MRQRKDQITGEVYLSMEQFFACILEHNNDEDFDMNLVFLGKVNVDGLVQKHGRERIRTQMRRFTNACDKMEIDYSLYKSDTCYKITKEVSDLFCYMSLFFVVMYSSKIKKGKWSQIPREDLVILRRYLAEALYDTNLGAEEIESNLKYFERATGCPITYYSGFNLITDDAIAYWKETCKDKLTKQQWDALYAIAEYDFDHYFRVKYSSHVGKLVNKMLEENGFDPID